MKKTPGGARLRKWWEPLRSRGSAPILGSEQAVPGRVLSHAPRSSSSTAAPLLTPEAPRAAVWGGHGTVTRPPGARWRPGALVPNWAYKTDVFFEDPKRHHHCYHRSVSINKDSVSSVFPSTFPKRVFGCTCCVPGIAPIFSVGFASWIPEPVVLRVHAFFLVSFPLWIPQFPNHTSNVGTLSRPTGCLLILISKILNKYLLWFFVVKFPLWMNIDMNNESWTIPISLLVDCFCNLFWRLSIGIVRTNDHGDCLLIGIVQTMDFGDNLLIGIVWTIGLECCLWIGNTKTPPIESILLVIKHKIAVPCKWFECTGNFSILL